MTNISGMQPQPPLGNDKFTEFVSSTTYATYLSRCSFLNVATYPPSRFFVHRSLEEVYLFWASPLWTTTGCVCHSVGGPRVHAYAQSTPVGQSTCAHCLLAVRVFGVYWGVKTCCGFRVWKCPLINIDFSYIIISKNLWSMYITSMCTCDIGPTSLGSSHSCTWAVRKTQCL